jgi:hypothetical protein
MFDDTYACMPLEYFIECARRTAFEKGKIIIGVAQPGDPEHNDGDFLYTCDKERFHK